MTEVSLDLKKKILRLLTPDCRQGIGNLSEISDDDWMQVLDWSSDHRFASLLYFSLGETGEIDLLPEIVRLKLKALSLAFTQRSLKANREMVVVAKTLNKSEIEHVFLKGSYLDGFAYPRLGLRPMRDLDVLVEAEDVLRSYADLLEAGCSRHPKFMGDPEAVHQTQKHLPPLMSEKFGILIEVHKMLFSDNIAAGFDDDGYLKKTLWAHRVFKVIAGERLSFESPTVLLYHLCIHAAVGHHFNNGPLVFADVYYLLKTHQVDWIQFWSICKESNQVRAASLVLEITDRFVGEFQTLPESAMSGLERADEHIMNCAISLAFYSTAQRQDLGLVRSVRTSSKSLKSFPNLIGKVFPSRQKIAQMYPVKQNSYHIYRYYPKYWFRLATNRFPNLLGSMGKQDFETAVEMQIDLISWLS